MSSALLIKKAKRIMGVLNFQSLPSLIAASAYSLSFSPLSLLGQLFAHFAPILLMAAKRATSNSPLITDV